ncbi:MAG TPA: ABC transporter ATP-binding protein [Myxococcales bacterium]|nr:ABC transporter ATP-binding protein [Myxococcales bacterium]
MLEVNDLHAWYGKSHVLHGVTFRVEPGEVVALLGRNGVGRSTTIKTIMGMVAARGSVRFRNQEILGLKAHEIARCGVGYVPEDRAIFPDLTVRQNLALGMKQRRESGRWKMEDAFVLFPQLRERADAPGGVLSGGEQQMLTLCRTLMGDPDLLLIDEPTEGLAPKTVAQVSEFICEMKKRSISVLLVEQKLTISLHISQRLYVMGHGRVVFHGTPDELRGNESLRKEWLEV